MELKHIIATDEAAKSVTLLLYGRIGDKVDGDYFAREIEYLGKEYDEIIIRINSEGGNVLQGLSIFNAIMQSPAYTIAQVDGVAASMAGVIPFAANSIRMNDFARIMLHNPYYPGKESAKLTKKEQKALENLGGVLNSLVAKRCKDTDIEQMLSEETWLTAKEAKEIGIVDEIINTGQYDEVESALSGIAALSDNNYNQFLIQNDNDMKVIASLFNLAATATEEEITAQVKALQLENTSLKAKQEELTKLANDLKAEQEAARKVEIEAAADKAIAAGYFKKEERENLISLGTASFDTFKNMLDKLQPVQASLTATIEAAAGAAGQTEKKDLLWYSRNDPQALAEMRVNQPDQYKKLEEEYEKLYC